MHYLFYNGSISAKGAQHVQALAELAVERGRREITLVLTSHGGDVAGGIGLYHYIRSMPYPFLIHAAGICSSIAATILQAGARRFAVPSTLIAFHLPTYVEGPLIGQPSTNAALIQEPFVSRANWPQERVSEWFTTDEKAMTEQQALTLGVIDEVKPIDVGTSDTWETISVPS